ncbi:hypothetical protein PsorP6_010653 [Peronosclerospora sorghi]|uniref:Uncharacterized protein n=1 Tax=Peronosclerospora sorghi TaxID=230839 RepID=A0ACC0VXK5_9STRA|nr:hypothetical protein PsorP6_010653 [Peronosclerospora sorghi]
MWDDAGNVTVPRAVVAMDTPTADDDTRRRCERRETLDEIEAKVDETVAFVLGWCSRLDRRYAGSIVLQGDNYS